VQDIEGSTYRDVHHITQSTATRTRADTPHSIISCRFLDFTTSLLCPLQSSLQKSSLPVKALPQLWQWRCCGILSTIAIATTG